MKNNKLKKLQVLLGLVPQSFAYKTTEGVEMEIEGDGMEIGRKVYIITPEGELPPLMVSMKWKWEPRLKRWVV